MTFLGWERPSNSSCSIPCHGHGHIPLSQVALSPEAGLGHFHSSLGSLPAFLVPRAALSLPSRGQTHPTPTVFSPCRGGAEHRDQPGGRAQARLPPHPQRQRHERGGPGRGGGEHSRDIPWALQESVSTPTQGRASGSSLKVQSPFAGDPNSFHSICGAA